MRNFYYITSFNLTNPRIKSMLERMKFLSISGTMIDFKLRSKLFMNYGDTLREMADDFSNKLESIYPEEDQEHQICQFSVANPSILPTSSEEIAEFAARFGGKYLTDWDENCCSVCFFAENDGDEDDVQLDMNAWMVKYEVMYTEDAIELSGNGDFAFSPINVPKSAFTSTYH